MDVMEGHPRGRKLRVTLDRVQILHSKEPFFQKYSELRLRARVSTRDNGGIVTDTVLPESGTLRVAARGENTLELGTPIFEGWVEEHLEVELSAAEVDRFSENDAYQTYRRVHRRSTAGFVGRYGPGDEKLDAEELADWRVWYTIEEV